MEIEFKNKEIHLKRDTSELDKFVFETVKIVKKHTKYVIISGYIAILFGRARGTEDIDMFIERIDFKTFEKMFDDLLENNMWCINGSNKRKMFDLLEDNLAIRFAKKDTVIPNFEIKFIKDIYSKYSLDNKIKVILNKEELYTSLLEMQIPYKLKLGSEKDLEDATHLYVLFEKYLDMQKMKEIAKMLKVDLGVLNERLQ
ncbi:MAG: hypothetical protein WC356_01110 [Candidatus Micrarchaeia archaeon]|jgi:hypothetical protein